MRGFEKDGKTAYVNWNDLTQKWIMTTGEKGGEVLDSDDYLAALVFRWSEITEGREDTIKETLNLQAKRIALLENKCDHLETEVKLLKELIKFQDTFNRPSCSKSPTTPTNPFYDRREPILNPLKITCDDKHAD